jgi:DNA-binding CsgD family transcriptional regulator
LLERAGQLATLDAALVDVNRRARGRLVFIGGEAGVGKTALVRAFCASQPRGVRILAGACDALFTPRPLGPVLDLAEALGGQLSQLAQREARPHAIAEAFLAALRAQPARSIVVVEDLHWADEATLDVLRLVARRMDDLPTLMLVTYRDDQLDRQHPLRVLLGELPGVGSVERMTLGRLTPAAVAQLAEPAGVDADDLYRKTGGNAFFVTEALAAGDVSIPPTVRDAVLARAARLRPGSISLLEAVAVVPPLVEAWLLESLAPELLEYLDECLDSGMLTSVAAGVAFRHELARLAIEESLSPIRRVGLHRRALDALATPPHGAPDLARLAHHAEAAADPTAVQRYAPAAAVQAAALGAHREAAAQYARALRYARGLPLAARTELLERGSYECHLIELHDEAIQMQEQALEGYRQLGSTTKEGGALRWLSRLLWVAGHVESAEAAGYEAVALLEPLPGRELALAYANLAQLRMNAEDEDGTRTWSMRAMDLANRLDCLDVYVHALNSIGSVEFLHGDLAGRDKLDESLRRARQAALEYDVARAYAHLSWAAVRVRLHAEARKSIDAGLEFVADKDLYVTRSYLLACRASSQLDQGDWARASATAAEVLADPRALPLARVQALVTLGLVRARRGDPGSQPLLDEAAVLAQGSREPQWIAPVAAARLEVAWLNGGGEVAGIGEATEPALELARARGAAWVVGDLAAWRWRSGVADAESDGAAEPYRLEMQGKWQAAAELWSRLGCPYAAALALASSTDEDALRHALAEMQRLGARTAAGIVAHRLRELGARGLPRGPRPDTRANSVLLTRRQLEILELLRNGLRNAEIAERLYLSPRTVDHHVSAILTKLNARSRTEAAQIAARLELEQEQAP